MKNNMEAYIDSFDMITLLLDKSIDPTNKVFYLIGEQEKHKLNIISSYVEEYNYKFVLQNIPNMKLHKQYFIYDNENNNCLLNSGSVIRTKEFEEKYKYDGPLGVEYSKKESVFRVWSPVAKEIYVELINGNKKEKVYLTYKDKGLWEGRKKGDLEGYGYLLYVRVFEEFKCIHDPYAISSSANGEYNYIIDINKLYKMKNRQPEFSGNYTDAVIYEASVRDFTYNLKSENKGTFLGMCENTPTKSGLPTGLDYIKYLGVTHLQLLPIFDFGGVDDIKKNSLYNWGYNPEQYFIPNGWYSKNPNDPYSRINEFLMLVDKAHEKGIRVVMDVVFNHVYKYEEFSFDYLVPGYYYRVEADGRMSNASGCGNDLATERYMCSRFVCDVLCYYQKVFKISGFRFDLMGLLDIPTLKMAYNLLNRYDNTVMLYGEGWNMNNPLPDHLRPHMFNHRKISEYAFFNDRYRNFIRGDQWNRNPGYAYGESDVNYDLFHLVTGSCKNYYKFNEPTQTVNYVECHDNYTMYDYGKTLLSFDDKKCIDAAYLALQVILVSQGIAFIHAGEEFFRTKQGVENSYNQKDSINKFDYNRRDKYLKYVNAIRDLIKIRLENKALRLSSSIDIKHHIHLLEGLCGFNTLAYFIENEEANLIIIIKNKKEKEVIKFEGVINIFTPLGACNIKQNEFILEDMGVYIYKQVK